MPRLISIAATALGLTVAICASAKLPPDGSRFADTMGYFFLGMTLLLGGAVGWRRTVDQVSDDSDSLYVEADPLVLTPQLASSATELIVLAPKLSDRELLERIDELIDLFLAPLVNDGPRLRRMFGPRRTSALLIHIAGCERLLNRAWSAVADQNRAEALDALQAASDIAASCEV